MGYMNRSEYGEDACGRDPKCQLIGGHAGKCDTRTEQERWMALFAALDRGEDPTVPREAMATDYSEAACGECVEFGFVKVDGGLRIRAVIEVPCHPTTAFDAQEHVLALHPLAPGVQIQYAERSARDKA